jgi:hypothetical protein
MTSLMPDSPKPSSLRKRLENIKLQTFITPRNNINLRKRKCKERKKERKKEQMQIRKSHHTKQLDIEQIKEKST